MNHELRKNPITLAVDMAKRQHVYITTVSNLLSCTPIVIWQFENHGTITSQKTGESIPSCAKLTGRSSEGKSHACKVWRASLVSKKAMLVKLSNCIVPLAFALIGILFSPAHADTTIVIVRHGEKPEHGLGQLTCQGLNRSLALAPLLLSRYGMPVAIYAPNPGQPKKDNGIPYAYIRPLATIEPLAIRTGLPVNLKWGMTNIEPLAAQVLASPAGTYIVAWEHHWGESLARHLLSRLGGHPNDVPRWKDTDFDSVFVIRASENGKGVRRVSFSHEQEGLDGLPESCSEGPRRGHP
jgi:hypothetical protein